MKKRLVFSALLIMFGFVTVTAANLDGKWKGSVQGPDGNSMELTYTFKVDGATMTGNVASEMGEIAISEGKVNGDEFEYTLDINGMIIKNKGKVTGDEIKLMSSSEWGENEIVLKRVKE